MAAKVGLGLRTGIMGMIYSKALRLSPKAGAEHNAGKVTNMLATDAARIDLAAPLLLQSSIYVVFSACTTRALVVFP